MATTNQNADDFGVSADEQLDDRDVRALTERMLVMPDGGSMFTVVGQNGNGEHVVDAKRDRCTCHDYEYNLPDGDRETCKHRARIAFATGERAIPGWVNMDAVDEMLGDQLPNSQPRVAMTDGGKLFREGFGRFETERVDGGVLVFDTTVETGRELAGFTDVDDWDAIRSELARRGLPVGSIHHETVFAPEEVGL